MIASSMLRIVRDGHDLRIRLGTATEDPGATVGDQLRRAVLRGELIAGDLLPSESEMAQFLEMALVLVRRELDRLAADDLIENRPGEGWFVTGASATGTP